MYLKYAAESSIVTLLIGDSTGVQRRFAPIESGPTPHSCCAMAAAAAAAGGAAATVAAAAGAVQPFTCITWLTLMSR